MTLPFFSRKSFGRYGSFSSLKRYTSKTSLISAYDFIKEKVVPDSMRKKPDETKLRLVVAFFFLVIVFVISLAQILYIQHKGEVSTVVHRGLKLDGAIGQGEICYSLKSEKFSKSFLSHIGKNKINF